MHGNGTIGLSLDHVLKYDSDDINGVMAQWRNGAMAQWRNGAMAIIKSVTN